MPIFGRLLALRWRGANHGDGDWDRYRVSGSTWRLRAGLCRRTHSVSIPAVLGPLLPRVTPARRGRPRKRL